MGLAIEFEFEDGSNEVATMSYGSFWRRQIAKIPTGLDETAIYRDARDKKLEEHAKSCGTCTANMDKMSCHQKTMHAFDMTDNDGEYEGIPAEIVYINCMRERYIPYLDDAIMPVRAIFG